jgi:vitamin B12 transporter
MFALPIDTDQIVVTASRIPQEEDATPASATIVDKARIERLGEPLAPALLRLTPSVAVTTQGPAGLLTEIRIRGAENNHTLLFIDGIRANDPATGDFARFELLNADMISRLEVVRGPQSALWGSQAIGGVVAINGVDDEPGHAAQAEAGAFGSARAGASLAAQPGQASLAGAIGWQSAAGIDSFRGDGDKDGYRNLSGRVRATYRLSPSVKVGASGFALTGRADFDGYDPLTFERADTNDSSRNRLAAGRLWAEFGTGSSAWRGRVGASLLGSSNRNYLDDEPLNRTRGTRTSLDGQVERRFATGSVEHRLVLAADAERETFRARDTLYGGFTNQDRDRSHQAVTLQWSGSARGISGDVAVRRDLFNRFRDATSLRVSALVPLGNGFALAGAYAEGIAQPTFFDLYGFFPNNFVGNPSLKAESSRGFEGSLRFRRARLAASLTAYRQRLHDEIVDVFDLATFQSSTENRNGTSHRSGIEAELALRPSAALRVTASYAYLKADQPDSAGDRRLEELRRPKHSGSLVADGQTGRWSYGAALSYVGARRDREEIFPFGVVRLKPYWLASARAAFALTDRIELFARGSNLFDRSYQDSAGYRTEGRGLFAGIRLAGRRSSP